MIRSRQIRARQSFVDAGMTIEAAVDKLARQYDDTVALFYGWEHPVPKGDVYKSIVEDLRRPNKVGYLSLEATKISNSSKGIKVTLTCYFKDVWISEQVIEFPLVEVNGGEAIDGSGIDIDINKQIIIEGLQKAYKEARTKKNA